MTLISFIFLNGSEVQSLERPDAFSISKAGTIIKKKLLI